MQERQRIVPTRLQRVRKAAECAPGQLPLEAEQRQRRVACVEGRLAARAGEAQRVARQRLPAHRQRLPRRARAACRCRECAATQGTPKTFVVKEAERNLGDGGGRGVIFFEGANKLVLIEAAIGRRPCPPQHRPFLNINVNICNMHVESCKVALKHQCYRYDSQFI